MNRLGEPAHLRDLLRAADLGIEDFRVETVEEDPFENRRPRIKGQPVVDVKAAGAMVDTPRSVRPVRHELWLRHTGRNGSFELPLTAESLGTKAIVEYALALEQVTSRGGTLVVDELDSSLHPRLSAFLVGLFQDPERNPHGAQLLFTSHDVSLLGRKAGEDILKRDQIWFASKNEFGRNLALSVVRLPATAGREQGTAVLERKLWRGTGDRRYLRVGDCRARGAGGEAAETGRQEDTEA
ncbi:hypothetical protein GCM10023238_18580 [Streptomyces heliomycini]